MRRVTFMVHRYWMLQLGWKSECQRTSYYMPWGIVRVDELSKMSFAENYTVCLAYNEETGKWRA